MLIQGQSKQGRLVSKFPYTKQFQIHNSVSTKVCTFTSAFHQTASWDKATYVTFSAKSAAALAITFSLFQFGPSIILWCSCSLYCNMLIHFGLLTADGKARGQFQQPEHCVVFWNICVENIVARVLVVRHKLRMVGR